MALQDPIDPVKKYQINGVACPVRSAYLSAAVANNQSLVAAVTGSRIRVMGLLVQSLNAGGSQIGLKDASGGSTLLYIAAPAITVGPTFIPIVDSGYVETTAGNGLFLDCSTHEANVTVFYITYQP